MRQLKKQILAATIFATLMVLTSLQVWAGETREFAQIDTCYHWLRSYQMDAKLQYAEQHQGELYFYGDVPVYCWRSPLGAYSRWEDHGDQLIRIKLKKGLQIVQRARIEQLSVMKAYAKAIYSNDGAWQEYTITPNAVESWSVYEPEMMSEMTTELKYYQAGLVTANDVFYDISFFDLNFMNERIPPIIQAHLAKAAQGKSKIYGVNTAEHFKTAYVLPWQKFLKRDVNNNLQSN